MSDKTSQQDKIDSHLNEASRDIWSNKTDGSIPDNIDRALQEMSKILDKGKDEK